MDSPWPPTPAAAIQFHRPLLNLQAWVLVCLTVRSTDPEAQHILTDFPEALEIVQGPAVVAGPQTHGWGAERCTPPVPADLSDSAHLTRASTPQTAKCGSGRVTKQLGLHIDSPAAHGYRQAPRRAGMLCLFGKPDGHHGATSFSESLPSYQGYHVIVAAPLNLQADSLAMPSLARAKHEPHPLDSWPRNREARRQRSQSLGSGTSK